jgi:hypothetical protein
MAILLGCILLAILAFGISFTTFSGIHVTIQAVGKDTAPPTPRVCQEIGLAGS